MTRGKSQRLVIGRLLVRFPWSACGSVQTAPGVLVGTLHGSHHHQCVNVGITVSHFGQKLLINVDVDDSHVVKQQRFYICEHLKRIFLMKVIMFGTVSFSCMVI